MPKAFLRVAVACLLLASADATADEVFDDAPRGDPSTGTLAPEARVPFYLGPSGPWHVVSLLGHDVAPGDKQRLSLRTSESFAGDSVTLPVLVARGVAPGPTLCLIAGVHGDELNGIEVARRVFEETSPAKLSGMLLVVPVANLHGFRRSSRYLPDRRDLNRFFPGDPGGSSASRIANALFDGVIRRCGALVDFHTGSFHRSNLPQVRVDLTRPGLLDVAQAFGLGVVVHSRGSEGTLRKAATDAGIAAITYEAGEPMRFQVEEMRRGAEGTLNLMTALGMLKEKGRGEDGASVYFSSRWVRVNDGGIFLTERRLGEEVRIGDELGTVTDPISNERSRILSPVSGRIIGMAFPQVVIPGFAAFHIGIQSEAPIAAVESPPGGRAPGELDSEENPE